jgi:hypothetical protein
MRLARAGSKRVALVKAVLDLTWGEIAAVLIVEHAADLS